ncbi:MULTISPECIES: ribbon-helix-helix domain-containing protein [Bacillus cereus group]|uniref:ribbon-helix-helix domain-containing protein n=1 Tax=Bacillus cereus group TaxID=86661 RepID=UPI001F59F1BD|nr:MULTISPECIES: ribbon-helix-helix domain-containing protein [Bacillus cereus group]MDH2870567.1 ribbon-helix-helix domain-containing protein [Bacillus cytotoxicus]
MGEMVRVNTRISSKMNDWLDNYSKETGIPKSTLIHLALEQYVNQKVMLEEMPKMQQMMSTLFQTVQQHQLSQKNIFLK